MEAVKGLSSETIKAIILAIQDYRFLWDKTQAGYKDQDLKEVTWNNIGGFVGLPGMYLIFIHIFVRHGLLKPRLRQALEIF